MIDKLFIEIQKGDNEAVKSFLEKKRIDIEDNYGRTILINAALYGNLELIKWLLEKQANINHIDKNGYTALHFAAQEGHMNIAKVLLKFGTNPNIQDKNGNTPAWVAIMYWNGGKNFDTLKALIDANADLTLRNKADRAAFEMIPEKIKIQLGIL